MELPHVSATGFYTLDGSAGADIQHKPSRHLAGIAALGTTRAPQARGLAGHNAAYLLDLSPQARDYLRQANQPAVTKGTTGEGFALSPAQQRSIAEILAGFADAPYTQETFDAIQAALQKAGLGSHQLAAKYRANRFNSTATLLDALTGGGGKIPGSQPVSDAELEARSQHYMYAIAQQWQRMQPERDGSAVASDDVLSVQAVRAADDSTGA